MKLIKITLLLLIINSCNLECFVDTNTNARIKIIAKAGVKYSELKSLTIFVFDSNNKFILTQNQKITSTNQNQYQFILPLASNNYTYVIWGNLINPYLIIPEKFIEGQTSLNECMLYLNRQSQNVNNDIPHLFFGIHEHILKNYSETVIIPLIQNTNSINLIVKGITNNDKYSLNIVDNNSKYKFDNSFAPDEEFKYIAEIKPNNNYLISNIKILKLVKTSNTSLEIYNSTTDKLVYKQSLIEILDKLEEKSKIKWVDTHEFNIEIIFESSLSVDVIINGWKVIDNDTQLP